MYSSKANGYEKYSSSDHLHQHVDAPATGIPVSSGSEPYFTTSYEDMSSQSGHSHMTHPPTHLRPRALGPWSTGLFDCFSDPKNCCITFWCPCITFGQIAEIVDKGSISCGASGALYTLIACVTAFPCIYSCFYRSKMRQQYSLEESPCGDCLVHCFCEGCALCQEYRELKSRGFDMKLGCVTLWCPCITFGQIAETVDKGSISCCASGALYILIACVTAFPCIYSCFYRSKMRQQYTLDGSPCGDCLVHCFCEGCALCQEYRELKFRGFDMKPGWHGNIKERNREVGMSPVVEEGMSRHYNS